MTEQEFHMYADYVGQHFGIQLPHEKKALLETRLYKLFNSGQIPGHADPRSFYQYLQQDRTGRARQLMADAITTNHTYFMRESDHFEYFSQAVLPYWAQHIRDGDVRTWCAACSSGEEAYTLAMLLQDFFQMRGGRWEYSLLATDLSPEILAAARKGIYLTESVRQMPVHFQTAYFHRVDDAHMQVVDFIRRQVIYRQFNLMCTAFPFKRPFHTIFCRNVMIYFDVQTRHAIARRFYDFLEPGGFLFVGHSEVIDRQSVPFDYVMPSVYRRM